MQLFTISIPFIFKNIFQVNIHIRFCIHLSLTTMKMENMKKQDRLTFQYSWNRKIAMLFCRIFIVLSKLNFCIIDSTLDLFLSNDSPLFHFLRKLSTVHLFCAFLTSLSKTQKNISKVAEDDSFEIQSGRKVRCPIQMWDTRK